MEKGIVRVARPVRRPGDSTSITTTKKDDLAAAYPTTDVARSQPVFLLLDS